MSCWQREPIPSWRPSRGNFGFLKCMSHVNLATSEWWWQLSEIFLLEKQKFLYDALLQLRKATSSLEYSNVITSVRKAVELLEPNKPAGNMLMNALRKSYSLVNIAEDIDARASAELIEELIETLIGSNGFLTNIFKYSSKLGPHVKTASGKLCKPRPYKMDAEFAILQAMVTLNYMIRLLKNAAIRT